MPRLRPWPQHSSSVLAICVAPLVAAEAMPPAAVRPLLEKLLQVEFQ